MSWMSHNTICYSDKKGTHGHKDEFFVSENGNIYMPFISNEIRFGVKIK